MNQISTSYITNFDDSGRPTNPTARNVVRFFMESVQQEDASIKAGRPVFTDIEMIEIIIPGDMKTRPVRRAHNGDHQQYAREYEAFKRQESVAVEGTPIEHWNVLTRAQVATLKHMNIHTIDAVAALSDGALSNMNMLGASSLRRQAQVYLSNATDGALSAKIVHENDALKQRLAVLESQVAMASMKYEALAVEKGRDVSGESLRGPVHMHPAMATEAAPIVIPRPIEPTIPAGWRDMDGPELMKLAKTLTPTPIRTKADAMAIIEEATGA